MSDAVGALRQEVRSLSEQLASMTARVHALEGTARPMELRTVSEADALKEVKAFFENHHGETLYPSDVASALSLDYDLVAAVVVQLERRGEIRAA